MIDDVRKSNRTPTDIYALSLVMQTRFKAFLIEFEAASIDDDKKNRRARLFGALGMLKGLVKFVEGEINEL